MRKLLQLKGEEKGLLGFIKIFSLSWLEGHVHVCVRSCSIKL